MELNIVLLRKIPDAVCDGIGDEYAGAGRKAEGELAVVAEGAMDVLEAFKSHCAATQAASDWIISVIMTGGILTHSQSTRDPMHVIIYQIARMRDLARLPQAFLFLKFSIANCSWFRVSRATRRRTALHAP